MAYAAGGEFRQAIETAKLALQLLDDKGPAELAEGIQARLRLYEKSTQYVEPANNK